MKKTLLMLCALFCASQTISALTIEDGQYYTIANRNDVNLYVKDTGVDVIQMGSLDDACYWQFIATANEGCYYVRNKKTGRYAQQCSTSTEVNVLMGDTPVEYRVKECTVEGTDMFGLASTNLSNTEFTSGCIGWNWKGDNTVQTFAAAAGTNHRSFWKLTLVTPPMTISKDKVYTLSNRNDNNVYIKDNGGEELAMGGLDNASLWQFEDAGSGQFYVKNVKTGRYAQACATSAEVPITMGNAPVAYVIVNCSDQEGKDCFGLTSADMSNTAFTDGCIGWNWRNDNVVQTFAAKAGTNHRSFWKFTELEPQSITSAGYATYCATEDVLVLGAQAYKGIVGSTYVSLEEVSDVPAGSAVVLKGNLYATVAKTASSDMTGNALEPSTGITSDGTQYILAEKEGQVGFYKAAVGTTITAGKAYFISSTGIKAFYFEGDDATGINEELRMKNEESSIYNLAGQRLQKMQKGINIVGGKKVLY
ncbi:MAG: hypothetical protein IJ537_08870 [Bacteroidaceae bacterium]|nr:hypothetical protein [Bacteroidaceae bacterium]